MPTIYSGERFFEGWRSIPYRFEDETSKSRFALITNSNRGQWIDWDLFYRLKNRVAPDLGLTREGLVARSTYNPEILRPHCRKWEEGQNQKDLSYNRASLGLAVSRVRKRFSLREKVKPIAFSEVPWKNDTNFGAPTFSNARNDSTLQARAIAGAKSVMRGKKPEPFTAYARGRNPEEARITMAEPKEMFIVGGSFFYPYFWALKTEDSPYAGCAKRLSISARVNHLKWKSRFILAADYSRFDSTIPQVLTSCAFDIIKSNFEMTPKEERLWETYVLHFNTNGVLMPDGRVYFGRRGGIPSGAIFTSIVGSIVNALLIEYVAIQEPEMLITDYVVLGDDSAIGLLNPMSVDVFAQHVRDFGVTVGKEDSVLQTITESIHFLGHYWEYGCSRRDVKETIYRLCCPENVKPWNRADFGSTEYCIGLFDKVKDYQNDNEWFWELGNMLIDSFLEEDQPWLWGKINRRNFYYSNMVLDSKQHRLTGLARFMREYQDEYEGASVRLSSVY